MRGGREPRRSRDPGVRASASRRAPRPAIGSRCSSAGWGPAARAPCSSAATGGSWPRAGSRGGSLAGPEGPAGVGLPAYPAGLTCPGCDRTLHVRRVPGAGEELVLLVERLHAPPSPAELAAALPVSLREAEVLALLAAGEDEPRDRRVAGDQRPQRRPATWSVLSAKPIADSRAHAHRRRPGGKPRIGHSAYRRGRSRRAERAVMIQHVLSLALVAAVLPASASARADGGRIYFLRGLSIFALDPAGGVPTLVRSVDGCNVTALAVSPDGSRLADADNRGSDVLPVWAAAPPPGGGSAPPPVVVAQPPVIAPAPAVTYSRAGADAVHGPLEEAAREEGRGELDAARSRRGTGARVRQRKTTGDASAPARGEAHDRAAADERDAATPAPGPHGQVSGSTSA